MTGEKNNKVKNKAIRDTTYWTIFSRHIQHIVPIKKIFRNLFFFQAPSRQELFQGHDGYTRTYVFLHEEPS